MKRNKMMPLKIAAAVFAIAAGIVVGMYYMDNRRANFSQECAIFIYPDTSVADVVSLLNEAALTKNVRSLERCLVKLDAEGRIKPGRYVIKPTYTSIYVARMLVYGWQSPHNLTLSGTIRTKEVLAQKISSQMMVDSASVAEALSSEEFLSEYGFTPETVFAMILPDTYQMYWTASVKDIFDRFKREYDVFWTKDRLAKAKKAGLSKLQVSVLASIVSGETLKSDEYPLIAGVYLNRYRKGMRLQADPTVAFCFNYEPSRILKKHLNVDSPYNTYKYAGLPPAPINVPPKACVDAVLNAEKHNYLYFCASPEFDGSHRFASSYNEHMKNARAFQRELTIRRKAQQLL